MEAYQKQVTLKNGYSYTTIAKQDLHKIAVGHKIAINCSYNGISACEVTRVTKCYIFCGVYKFNRKTGMGAGNCIWNIQ